MFILKVLSLLTHTTGPAEPFLVRVPPPAHETECPLPEAAPEPEIYLTVEFNKHVVLGFGLGVCFWPFLEVLFWLRKWIGRVLRAQLVYSDAGGSHRVDRVTANGVVVRSANRQDA